MKLPIQLVLNTDPPRFRWTVNGVEQEAQVPPYLEQALVDLIDVAARQELAIKGLTTKLKEAEATIAKYVEQENRRMQAGAASPLVPVSSSKKSKG